MEVWSVPLPVSPSRHGFKYRLVFVRDGERLVGYDNERGKELGYRFTDVDNLVRDFLRDVEELA